MAGRNQMNSSTAANGQDASQFTDAQNYAAIPNAQPTNGHIDFSFRKRFEKVDWRKIGMSEFYEFLFWEPKQYIFTA